MLFLINTHIGILRCMVYITICYEGILYKYLVFIISTAKSKEAMEQNIYLNTCTEVTSRHFFREKEEQLITLKYCNLET